MYAGTLDQLESILNLAELFLLKMIYKGSSCVSFDQVRYWYYCKKMCNFTELPPTSSSIRLHILRSHYVTNFQISLLDEHYVPLNPLHYGYYEADNYLLPEKIKNLFPPIDELILSCNCQKCTTKRCCCFKNNLNCTKFCKCKIDETCENIYNNN